MRTRKLTAEEIELGRSVFEDSIEWNRLVVTDLLGLGRRQFTVPGKGRAIYLNLGKAAYEYPAAYSSHAYSTPGQMFIHELVHAWQLCRRNRFSYLVEGAAVQLNHAAGRNAYAFGPAGYKWESFNLEQQAAIVDTWFAGADGYPPCSEGNPYFRYVRDSIRQ